MSALIGPPGEGLHEAVVEVAGRHGLDPAALDWHLEAVHGMERHDAGYAEAADIAAQCMLGGGCGDPAPGAGPCGPSCCGGPP